MIYKHMRIFNTRGSNEGDDKRIRPCPTWSKYAIFYLPGSPAFCAASPISFKKGVILTPLLMSNLQH